MRIECAKCKTLIGYSDAPIENPKSALTNRTGANEIRPSWWLYVSRRIDVFEVPNEPLWDVVAFTWSKAGDPKPTPYYRLTPQVITWLDAAGAALERQVLTGQASRDQLDLFIESMNPVWVFSGRCLDRAAVRSARLEPPSLPLVADGPRWDELVPAMGFFSRDIVAVGPGFEGGKKPKRVA